MNYFIYSCMMLSVVPIPIYFVMNNILHETGLLGTFYVNKKKVNLIITRTYANVMFYS